jgi:hypothetical protein
MLGNPEEADYNEGISQPTSQVRQSTGYPGGISQNQSMNDFNSVITTPGLIEQYSNSLLPIQPQTGLFLSRRLQSSQGLAKDTYNSSTGFLLDSQLSYARVGSALPCTTAASDPTYLSGGLGPS